MQISLMFVLSVVVISLLVSLFVTPVVSSFMWGTPVEGFNDSRLKWNGNTLTVNGSVNVNGTVSGKMMKVASNLGNNNNAMLFVPSMWGKEGPYIRFYDRSGKSNMYLMAGANGTDNVFIQSYKTSKRRQLM